MNFHVGPDFQNEKKMNFRFGPDLRNEKKMKNKRKKKRKKHELFHFFSFFFRSESSFRFGSDLKVHVFFIPRFFEIFSQTSSLIVFILKLQVYDNVKHEPALFQF